MDGYAVRVADVPGLLRVVGEVAAGQTPAVAVDPGTAVRIMTGAALPDGTEAVLPLEEVEERGGMLHARVSTVPGRHLRPAGDDVRPGDVVLDRGQVVGAAQLAALISAGVTSVRVRPVWRVAVLSTGDELVAAGRIPGPAQIVDCNGPALAAAAIAAGAEVVHLGQLPDVPDVLIGALDALPACDLIVTSGGVSMGAYDVVKAALKPLGIGFEQVAMQPGKPQGWGHFRGGPAFLGLPGNPAAALICFELFGRAALGRERSTSASRAGRLPGAHLGPQAAVPARPPGRNDRPRGGRSGFAPHRGTSPRRLPGGEFPKAWAGLKRVRWSRSSRCSPLRGSAGIRC